MTHEVFCADSISYIAGDYVGYLTTSKKLDILCDIFTKDLIRSINLPGTLSVMMPILTQSLLDAESLASSLPYKTYALRFLDMQSRFPIGDMPIGHGSSVSNNPSRVVLDVKAELPPDSYSLYGLREGIEGKRYVGRAQIPSYQCSKMMNTLFRNMRENADIDLIEESEDEDDFQDIREDKFVNTDKVIRMVFDYCPKTRKYIPIGIADSTASTLSVVSFPDSRSKKDDNSSKRARIGQYVGYNRNGNASRSRIAMHDKSPFASKSSHQAAGMKKHGLSDTDININMVVPKDMIELYRTHSRPCGKQFRKQ
jgi:hypothetical protein